MLALAFVATCRGQVVRARRCLLAVLVFIVVVGTLPLGEWLLRPLETRFAPAPVIDDPAGIIILGGGEDGRAMAATGLAGVNEAGDRFFDGMALARSHPGALLIFTGGSGALLGEGVRGSDVAARIFRDAGIADGRIVLEGDSRNTAENAANTRDLVGEVTEGPWVLVTSAFHMPRAVGAFCAAGWRDIVPYPVDHRGVGQPGVGWRFADRLDTLNTAIREAVGLWAYRVTGRSSALFPQTC